MPYVYDVDLARYVRTPAGERRYHKKIGEPIGHGGARVILASESRVTGARVKMSVQAPPKKLTGADAVKAQILGLKASWDKLPEHEKARDRKAVRSAIRADRGLPGTGSQWGSLDDAALARVLDHPDVNPAVRREAQAELLLRQQDQEHIDQMLHRGTEAAKSAEPGKEAGAFFKAVTKFSPRTALVLNKIAKKLKEEGKEHRKVAGEEARKTVVRTLFIGGLMLGFSLLTGHPDMAEVMDKLKDIPNEFAG